MLRATSNATTPATLVDYFYSTTKLNKSRLCSCAFGAAAAVLLCYSVHRRRRPLALALCLLFIHTRCLGSVVCLHAKRITGDGQIRAIHDVLTVDAAGALRRLHAALDQLL